MTPWRELHSRSPTDSGTSIEARLQGSSSITIENTRSGRPGRSRSSALVAKRPPISEWLLFLLFIAPNFILFGIFTYWPMIQTAYLSGVRWDMISPTKRWVGPDNYRYLWNDDTFRQVLVNSFWFAIGAVGGSLVLGLSHRAAAEPEAALPQLRARLGLHADPAQRRGYRHRLGLHLRSALRDHCRRAQGDRRQLARTGWAIRNGRCRRSSSSTSGRTLAWRRSSSWPDCRRFPRDLYEAATVDGAGG